LITRRKKNAQMAGSANGLLFAPRHLFVCFFFFDFDSGKQHTVGLLVGVESRDL
jgi:hypothetical protein